MKLAIVLSHPTQYYSPWFRWVAGHTDIELRVFYLWDFGVRETHDPRFGKAFMWDIDLLSGYEHEFVPNTATSPGTEHFSGLRNPEIKRRLGAWKPSALLLFGYKSMSHLSVLLWARLHHVPVLFRGDSHFLGRGVPPLAHRLVLRTLYAQFAGFLAVGAANTDYFATLGVPRRMIFRAPHSVDASRFDPNRAEHRKTAQTLRSQLGIPEQTRVVLFAGKLVAEKQPRELLEAFLVAAEPESALVFVGDGSEKGSLVARAKSANSGIVHFLPFANQSEMPSRYLLADLFALPSRGHYETWGLAVNEAMHMGVPALVSDLVGCQRDLVSDGETGWIFPANDPAALQAQMTRALRFLASTDRRAELSRCVKERIGGYTYAATTAGLVAALETVGARTR